MNNRVTFVCQHCGHEEVMHLFSWRPPNGLRCPKCYGMMNEADNEYSDEAQQERIEEG